ncbi:hypothetical protein BX600DRAFT_480366 [Xylariales sp. PMI_506]|nr:hypothetical protein BX600DRAFT_480366 [Xylariales sp. PMI_506]
MALLRAERQGSRFVIVCDEQKPSCKNCVKHSVTCDFTQETGISSPTSWLATGGLAMVDLELLHNFSTATYLTLAETFINREFYRVTIVQMGFRCEYIMRAVLAISALHLAFHRPQMRNHYTSLATTYHQMAARSAMADMEDINPETAETLFGFSVMTFLFARQESDFMPVGDTEFPEWMFMLRGSHAFQQLIGEEKRRDGPLAILLMPFDRARKAQNWAPTSASMMYANPNSAAALSPADTTVASVGHQQLELLRGLIADIEADAESPARRAYDKAIDLLQIAYAHSDPHSSHEVVFAWLSEVTEDLLPLLSGRSLRQEAVAIVAFFTVLIKRLPSRWWTQGWADRLISKSWKLLDAEHRVWIHWAIGEIGWIP